MKSVLTQNFVRVVICAAAVFVSACILPAGWLYGETPATGFIHRATADNTKEHLSLLEHKAAQDRSAVVLVTPIYNPWDTKGIANPHPLGVCWWDKAWAVCNLDGAPIPEGAAFAVEVFAPGKEAFVHTATPKNIQNNWTIIDSPACNGRPDASIQAIPVLPSSEVKAGPTMPLTTGLYFVDDRWSIYNEDRTPMSDGSTFNVLVQEGLTLVADEGNTKANWAALKHPALDGKAEAVVLATHVYNPGGKGGVYVVSPIGVYYVDGLWAVFTEDGTAMPPGAAFNLRIAGGKGAGGTPTTLVPSVVLRPTGEAAGTSGTVADWTKTVHLRPNLAASLEAPLLSGEYGWDFETGTLEEWQREDDPSNPAFASQPTCGSNVAVGRISPPGYDPQIDTNIGGDFWNTGFQNGYSGKYWIGTFEARRDGTVVPFTTQGDGKTGKLRSPQFRIDTDYITFLLGGGSTHLERIELQVKGPTMGYRGGLGVDYLSSSPPPANDGEWTVLYAASPRESSEEMRRVYWDVRDLRGRTARFRIVDDSAGGWGHINADDFRGTNVLVPGLGRFEETIRLPGGGTGSRRLTYERVEPMVRPLWGYADLHNHMMANLGYGGNSLTWGDPISTTVEQLYQGCRGSHVKNSNYETYHNLSPTAGAVLDIIEKRGGVHLYQGHKITGLGSLLHQSMHRDWVYRAYQGGLRLMVMRALNFRAMEAVLTWQYGDTRPATQSNTVNTRDIVAIQRQLDRVRDFVAANPWAEIAYTPADARAIIGRNHLAIVLGAESPDMADAELRNQYPSDWPTRLVQDLYGRGIRDITIVHATDNAVAGAALVSDMYNTANHFQNGTVFQVEAAPAESGIGFRLSNNVALGFVRDIVDICLTVGAVLGTRPPSALTTMCDASPCGARGRYPGCNNSMCFSGDCLQGSMQNYPPGGHRNVRGFAARGEEVISLLMDKGMMIDMDHMSEKTRRRLYEIAVAPRRGYTAENYPKYPIISSHANMREQQVAGEEFADSPFDISIVADTGGVIGPITNGEGLARDGITQRVWSNLTPLGKGSSVDWLARYYYALEKMGGRGVAMGTDMNSPSSHILSRREYPAVPQFTFPSLMPEQWIAPWPNFHNTLRHQAVRYENHGGDTSCVVERGNNDLDADRAKDINWYPVTEYTQILDIAWRPALKRYLPPEGYRDRPGVSFFHEPVEIIAHSGCTGDDFNVDGFVHYGLLPDLLQDVANQMTDWREDLAPLFSSAEDYIKAWEKACQLSATGRCETFRP